MDEMLERFLLRNPKFKSLDRKMVEAFLSDAMLEVSEGKWGNLYEKALFALTAHLLTVAQSSSDTDGKPNLPVASESAGQLSVSYAVSANQTLSDSLYATTSYGQEYLRLQKLIKLGVMVA